MTTYTYEVPFSIGTRVRIDGDKSLVAHVTGIWVLGTGGVSVEASWMHNGASASAWFPEWRLTAEDDE